jgi:molybdate transport system substrate-binding protein
VRVAGTFPPASHPPITYPVAVVAGPGEAKAREFVAFLASPEARSVLRRHGFGDP